MQSIQWFPGHMAKARREMTEALKKVDAILELVDARLPISSSNPILREIGGHKPRTIVLTRRDLADPVQTQKWQSYFQKQGCTVVTVDARNGGGVDKIVPALDKVAQQKREKDAKRGIRPRPLRTMVVGIPNVGKSSLINRLAKRAATKTGDKPGITQTQQWIRLGQVELLDTPGVLWPKFETEQAGFALAMSGAIKSGVLDLQSVCAYFIVFASQFYPQALEARYQVSFPEPMEWQDVASSWDEVEPILTSIGKSRGVIKGGGQVDHERVAELILRELQTGVYGPMTFDRAESQTAILQDDVE